MAHQKLSVVLLLPGNGVEHRQRNVAGQRFRNCQAAGLGNNQVGRLHIFLHFRGEIDQLAGLGAGLDFLFKCFIQLFIPAGNDNQLEILRQSGNLPEHGQDIIHAKAARHNQNGHFVRVQLHFPQQRLTVRLFKKDIVHRNAKGIHLVSGNFQIPDHLIRHILAGNNIGVYMIRQPGFVGTIVGHHAQQRSIQLSVCFQVGNHFRYKRMGGNNGIRLELFNERKQPATEQA